MSTATSAIGITRPRVPTMTTTTAVSQQRSIACPTRYCAPYCRTSPPHGCPSRAPYQDDGAEPRRGSHAVVPSDSGRRRSRGRPKTDTPTRRCGWPTMCLASCGTQTPSSRPHAAVTPEWWTRRSILSASTCGIAARSNRGCGASAPSGRPCVGTWTRPNGSVRLVGRSSVRRCPQTPPRSRCRPCWDAVTGRSRRCLSPRYPNEETARSPVWHLRARLSDAAAD
jgi:hypothetical protein